MPPSDAILDHPLAGPRFPLAPRRRPARVPGRRNAAAAAAVTLVLGAAATTYALNVTRVTRGRTTPATATETTLPYEPHELIVGYHGTATNLVNEVNTQTTLHVTLSPRPETTPNERLLQLPPGTTPIEAAKTIGKLKGVISALPDYIAHIAGQFFPDDPGRAHKIHGWESLQWNFMPAAGVNAPQAWANLQRDHRPGARGVTIAVVDTGIAFRNWKTFKRSPDFRGTKFADPCDLVVGSIKKGACTDPYALDREGHGTFVAGTIAEATNNNYGLTGLAYEATVMPVRVLDAEGNGDSSTIAAGIRYAVAHGAQVINLSIVFTAGTTTGQIPDVVSAITYAHNHGVTVVGAAGNDEDNSLDYPAALADVISVGATTRDRCLALYSDIGKNLDLVAPGGGNDVDSVTGSRCFPNRDLPDIYQMTLGDATHPSQFGLPSGWFGTSMAAPNVSAAAAMVIASGVLGKHPTPTQILKRLEATAHALGYGQPNNAYGYGLLNIGAATKKGGPLAPPTKPYELKGAGTASVVR
ncbi:MAG TPA: S8 family serine peptidase [Solirubrobacteraceae bacterium]|jgi:serine protease|nr:S8 family serine peptidase [Solirubrobacteraceae bacterium]